MIKLIKIHEYEIGLYFYDGEFRRLLEAGRHWFFDPLGRVRVEIVSQRAPLPPGRHVFWKGIAEVKLVPVDTRELILDVAAQEIMTADKVTLRLNALVSYRVVDVRQALTVVDDYRQALYRETQLVLRALL